VQDVKTKYRQFLLRLAERIESLTADIAQRARYVAEHPESISDKPRGARGYPHVCSLPDGTTMTIRQFDHSQGQRAGHQLEIQCANNRARIGLPTGEPIHVPDSDEKQLSLAEELAPYVVAILAGVSDIGGLNPAHGIADFGSATDQS
jgi:hypothetical protein